jgi:hypothetical protein
MTPSGLGRGAPGGSCRSPTGRFSVDAPDQVRSIPVGGLCRDAEAAQRKRSGEPSRQRPRMWGRTSRHASGSANGSRSTPASSPPSSVSAPAMSPWCTWQTTSGYRRATSSRGTGAAAPPHRRGTPAGRTRGPRGCSGPRAVRRGPGSGCRSAGCSGRGRSVGPTRPRRRAPRLRGWGWCGSGARPEPRPTPHTRGPGAVLDTLPGVRVSRRTVDGAAPTPQTKQVMPASRDAHGRCLAVRSCRLSPAADPGAVKHGTSCGL